MTAVEDIVTATNKALCGLAICSAEGRHVPKFTFGYNDGAKEHRFSMGFRPEMLGQRDIQGIADGFCATVKAWLDAKQKEDAA